MGPGDHAPRGFGRPSAHARAHYPNPARTGVAYMIAPVMRGWTARPEPVTMNMPHYMFYAPGVTDADIGGKPLVCIRLC
jgi:hypothetical protein